MFCLYFRLKEETHHFLQRKNKIQKKLEKYSMFQKYLDKVLEVAEEVNQINVILPFKKSFLELGLLSMC